MQYLAATLLVLWGLTVAIFSTMRVRGLYGTNSINGLRRRRPTESKAAWKAGLKALYPWTMASSAVLLCIAIAVLLVPESWFIATLLLGIGLVVLIVYCGIFALNRAILRHQRSEASGGI